MTAVAPGLFADVPVILLDLDGTIVESAPGILAALDHAFPACGEPHPGHDVLRTFIGPPLEDSFRGSLGMSASRAEALRTAYSQYYDSHGYQLSEPYAGMAELIRELSAAGRTVAVATNKPEPIAGRLLAHQGLAEDLAVIGGTDKAAGRRDKAAVIGSVLERLGIPGGSAAAVMVGDRLHDSEGAAVHELPSVLVGWGYGSTPEREAGHPFAPTVADLRALLLG